MNKQVEQIKTEIERLKESGCASPIVICDTLLAFIDSMREESKPKFKVGQTITDPTDSTFTFHINKIEDGRYIEKEDEWVLVKEADANYELVEEPISEDLEEEIQRYKDSHDYMSEYIRKVARYFALWGKIHLKDPVCKVLEEAATRAAYHQYQDREKDYISENEKKKFIEGAQWQKQQMTKDAIEGYVDQVEYPGSTWIELSDTPKDLKDGDKVKLLIVRENKV